MYVYMILPFESYDKLKIREPFAQAYIHTYLCRVYSYMQMRLELCKNQKYIYNIILAYNFIK